MTRSCRTCGTQQRHNDTYGCCSGCGLLFRGLQAFDKHFTRAKDGSPICQDPATVRRYPGQDRETNWYEAQAVLGGTAWAKALTPEERLRNAARFAS